MKAAWGRREERAGGEGMSEIISEDHTRGPTTFRHPEYFQNLRKSPFLALIAFRGDERW